MTTSLDPRLNQLLSSLPAEEWVRWLPALEHVDMPLGEVLYESGVAITHVASVGVHSRRYVARLTRREIIEHRDFEAAFARLLGNVAANEAGAPGNQYAHRRSITQATALGEALLAAVLTPACSRPSRS